MSTSFGRISLLRRTRIQKFREDGEPTERPELLALRLCVAIPFTAQLLVHHVLVRHGLFGL